MNKKVSIIIPCYNVSKTVVRCLESVVNQTYDNIEAIIINDGSTDDTEAKILSTREIFEQSKKEFKYFYQTNTGLGGAINAGLAQVTGDYICWIDSDDYLLPESVEKRLNVIVKHPEVGVVSSDAYMFAEGDYIHPIGLASDKKHMELSNQFENHLLGKAIFCSGCHMVDAKKFFGLMPDRKIYPARRGQNWQMLLPLYYTYPQIFINEPLYAYIQYPKSMSQGDMTKTDYIKRYNEYKDIVFNTLNKMHLDEKELTKYTSLYMKKYYREMFYTGISFHDYGMITRYLAKLVTTGELKAEDFKWLCKLAARQIKKITG